MVRPPYFHFTGGLLFAVLFLLALFFFFIFVPVSIVTEAFSRLGVTPVQGILLLLATLLGRSVNIPVHTSERLIMVPRTRGLEISQNPLDGQIRISDQPANELKKQEFVINLGGCVLPVILCFSFFLHAILGQGPNVPDATSLLLWASVSVIVVALACYALVRPDAVHGLRIPLFVPALVTMVTVFLLVPHEIAPVVAYISGTLGTILGACVVPVLSPRIRNGIAAPVVSIGGSGTFGGIFLAGILAVIFV